MKYLLAYLRAFWNLFRAASVIYMAMWFITGLNNLVALYLLWLICLAALAGPIGVLVSK
jgi:hypothetical protein